MLTRQRFCDDWPRPMRLLMQNLRRCRSSMGTVTVVLAPEELKQLQDRPADIRLRLELDDEPAGRISIDVDGFGAELAG